MDCCIGASDTVEELSLHLEGKMPTIETSKNALSDENWQARKEAVHNLGLLGHDSLAEVVSVLQKYMLRDEHWRVRKEAAKTLGMMGPDAVRRAEKALQEACKDPDNLVRDAALKALTSNGHPMPPLSKRMPNGTSISMVTTAEGHFQRQLSEGKADNAKDELAKPVEFRMSVTRSDDKKIGLDVDFRDGPYLIVKALRDGIFKDWNSTNPMKIEEGDIILEINGVWGDSNKLVELLMKAKTIQALVQKKSPAGHHSCASQLHAVADDRPNVESYG